MMKQTLIICLLALACSCSKKEEAIQSDKPQFELLTPEVTGINFSNDLVSTDEFNVYKYRNFYNGGGVAIGDINNDGLEDVYLTSNLNQNKLYLNLAH